MPATYSHKARQPVPIHTIKHTPAPVQAPRKYEVLGMEVDYETYRKYNYDQLYTIDGDILKDIPCNLWTLERYATEEHAKDYPIEAANARKILDQIREEITTITGKDEINMKTPRTASDFIDEMEGIYRTSRAIYNRLQEKVDNARAAMNAAHKAFNESTGANRQIAEARYTIAKDALKNAEDAFRKDVYELGNSHDAKVAELRQRFDDHLNEHYSASPDKLDAATMQLLNAGICTPVELARLAERHKDNPTMLRIVAGYADKIADNRNQSHENYMTCRSIAMMASRVKDGSREMNVFDSAVTSLRYGIQNDPATANRMHEYISGWFDDYREQMDNLPNIPVDLAPDAGGDDRGE